MFLSLLFLRKPPFKTYKIGETYYFDQLLDHFDSSETRTFKQRYYYNDTFCQGENSTKLIVFIGGEAAITETRVKRGAYMTLANRTGSCVVALEHRYFGESQPFEELTTPNLKYLTSDQALADLAYFIETFIKKQYRSRPKVLVVGGSYPGTLSSYFRMKYPHIADFSWASSPPLYVKNNFTEYDEHCAHVLHEKSPSCYENTRKIYEEFNNNPEAISKDAKIKFKDSVSHVSQLSILSDFIAGIVQYDNNYKLLTPFCNNQSDSKGPDFAKFGDGFYEYLKVEGVDDPSDLDDFALTNHSIHTDYADSLSWTWMTCNEFGWFQTASGLLRPAKVDLSYSESVCQAYFNVGIAKDINSDNSAKFDTYNSKLPATTFIYFSNGATDPWSELSVKPDIENPLVGRYSVNIQNASHCSDLGSESYTALNVARENILQIMEGWLNPKNESKCSGHGYHVLDTCICDQGYEGPYCQSKVISKTLFKVFDSLVVLLPTLMMIIIGCSAWFLFKKDGEDTEIKTIP